jgi:type I restriction enzyme M protein
MVALERDNVRLKGVLPKDYARPGLDKQRLGELIGVIATIELTAASEGEKTHRSVDLLGRVYEYFLTRFASAEGKNGGQFYTPSCVVRCLVEMLAPYKGRIYDPACGSGGMCVQSEKFVESHSGKIGDISIYGQESNATTRRLAIMNLAIRGIEADFGPEQADTFRRDLHPDLSAESVRLRPAPRPNALRRRSLVDKRDQRHSSHSCWSAIYRLIIYPRFYSIRIPSSHPREASDKAKKQGSLGAGFVMPA